MTAHAVITYTLEGLAIGAGIAYLASATLHAWQRRRHNRKGTR